MRVEWGPEKKINAQVQRLPQLLGPHITSASFYQALAQPQGRRIPPYITLQQHTHPFIQHAEDREPLVTSLGEVDRILQQSAAAFRGSFLPQGELRLLSVPRETAGDSSL